METAVEESAGKTTPDGSPLPEISDADVGAGAGIGVWVAGGLMVVLIFLAFCCLG